MDDIAKGARVTVGAMIVITAWSLGAWAAMHEIAESYRLKEIERQSALERWGPGVGE